MSFKNIQIVDESKILIEHDTTYRLNIFINKKERINKRGINIPVYIPILIKDIDNQIYKVIKAIFEAMLASVVLSRLGIPEVKNAVNIHVNGILPYYIKTDLEKILQFFMISRSLATNQPKKTIKVNIFSKEYTQNTFDIGFDKNRVIVALSGGIDSTSILNFLIKNKYEIFPCFLEYESGKILSDVQQDKYAEDNILSYFSINSKKKMIKIFLDEIKKHIPWNTRMYNILYNEDSYVQDRDDWHYYGRNALIVATLLFLCLKEKTKYIEIGHTKEGLFSTLNGDKREIYDKCGASIYFISLFNKILQKIFRNNSPLVVPSLIDMGKGSITRYILKHLDLLSNTRSCIEPGEIEEGKCFSCTDKMAGILANVDPVQFKIVGQKNYYEFFYNSKSLAKFKWIPRRNDSGIWGRQLRRFKENYPDIPNELKNSIYSPYAMIASCYNISKNPNLQKYIPTVYFKLQDNPIIDTKVIKSIHEDYTKEKKPIPPAQFAESYKTYSVKT